MKDDQQDEIRDKFYSTVEKGTISVYLMKELKMQLDHANHNMKKKLYRHYLKKELEQQGDKRPFTKAEQEDIEDFKDIMRGHTKVSDIKKDKMERVQKTIEMLNH